MLIYLLDLSIFTTLQKVYREYSMAWNWVFGRPKLILWFYISSMTYTKIFNFSTQKFPKYEKIKKEIVMTFPNDWGKV